jgi:hypothetical protein
MVDLNAAQAQLDEKQRELDIVQAQYDEAMRKKQVRWTRVSVLADVIDLFPDACGRC